MNTYKMTNREKLLFLFRESHHLQKEISGQPSSHRLEYAISVFTAQNLKAYTLWSICNPLAREEILENQGIIHDFQSGFVLLRSMYETILVSRFILLDEEFESCRNVIVLVAMLSGYREQKILLTNMQSKNPKFRSVVDGILQLKKDILKHSEFDNLPQFQRDYVNSDDIANRKWLPRELISQNPETKNEKIAVMKELSYRAGFHSIQHKQYYKYFSQYIHSEPFALQQIRAVRNPEQAQEMTRNLYSHGENFLSMSLDNHLKLCETEHVSISISKDVQEIIKLWKYINSQDLSKD